MGVAAAIANSRGLQVEGDMTMPITIMVVVIALVHALLCAFYFYSDEGIVASQTTARAIALSQSKAARLTAADEILKVTDRTVARRKEIAGKYGKQGVNALMEVLRQLGEDADNDGVPDVLEKHGKFQQNMSFASDTRQEHLDRGPEKSERPLPEQKRRE